MGLRTLDAVLCHGQIQGDRSYQEDSCGVFESEHDGTTIFLLVLADGMGGHVAGATASSEAVKGCIEGFSLASGSLFERLNAAVSSANTRLTEIISAKPELDGLGTTLVIAAIGKDGLMWGSVGDSPLWLVTDGAVERLNEDHSMVPVFEQMVETGRMTREEALSDSKRSALRSAICGDEISLVEVTEQPITLLGNEVLLLASDGVETLSSEEIVDIVAGNRNNMKSLVSNVLDKVVSVNKPNQDNATLIAFDVSGILGVSSHE